MPSKYICKKPPRATAETLQRCLNDVENENISIREAARRHGVPPTTIRDYRDALSLGHAHNPVGRSPSLPADVVSDLATLVKLAARYGFPFTSDEIKLFIASYVRRCWNVEDDLGRYLRRHCAFQNFMPGKDWMKSFLQQHNISRKTPASLEKCRKLAASDPWLIYEFYDVLESTIEMYHLHNSPLHVWNADESAFFLDPSGGRVLSAVGDKTKRVIAGSGRSCYTAMAAVSAAGTYLPPLIIYDAVHLHTLWKGNNDLPGTSYAVSSKCSEFIVLLL
jgi:transposase-like protein